MTDIFQRGGPTTNQGLGYESIALATWGRAWLQRFFSVARHGDQPASFTELETVAKLGSAFFLHGDQGAFDSVGFISDRIDMYVYIYRYNIV